MDHQIRGLGHDNKVAAIRNVIRRNNITLCVIQETKREIVDDSLIRSLWVSSGCKYVFQSSEGASGGIIAMWKEGVLHMEDHLICALSLSIRFSNVSDNFKWLFT